MVLLLGTDLTGECTLQLLLKNVNFDKLTLDGEREVACDCRTRDGVGGFTAVVALVTELHVSNDQLLTETRVVVLTWHRRIQTPPRHARGRTTYNNTHTHTESIVRNHLPHQLETNSVPGGTHRFNVHFPGKRGSSGRPLPPII